MIEYTFTSTDPDNYSEVYCPINYLGASEQVRWFASSIQSNCYVVVINASDMLVIKNVTKETDSLVCFGQDYVNGDEVVSLVNKFGGDEWSLSEDKAGRYYFSSENEIEITSMTYNYEQLLGFYYKHDYPIKSVLEDGKYIIRAKAVGVSLLSPVWYLLSNLGAPNAVNNRFNPWSSQYVSVAMRIMNSFTTEQPLQYSNSDYITTSQASSLSNIRCKLVDCNLQPIKLLVPLTVTITVQDTKDEHAEIMESFETMQKDMAVMKQILEHNEKNKQNVTVQLQTVEGGVTREGPELKVEDFTNEEKPKTEYLFNIGGEEGETDKPTPPPITPEQNQPVHKDIPHEKKEEEKPTEAPTEAPAEAPPQEEQAQQNSE